MISIIIPVYNAQKYISRCIDSLLSQKEQRFEIIIVDDGSTDNSKDICEKYALIDSRIKIYTQENQGVSAARNLGIQYSSEQYVTFIDADDWVEPIFLETILSEIDNADVLVFDAYISTGNKRVENHCWNDSRCFEGEEKEVLMAQAISYQYDSGYTPQYHGVGTAWGKVYKRELITQNNIIYDSALRISEDSLFTLQLLQCATKVKYIRKCLYNYRNDNVSATRSFDETYVNTNDSIIEKFSEFVDNNYAGNQLLENALSFRRLTCTFLILHNYVFASKQNDKKSAYKQVRAVSWIYNSLKDRKKYKFAKIINIYLLLFEKDMYYQLLVISMIERWTRQVRMIMVHTNKKEW